MKTTKQPAPATPLPWVAQGARAPGARMTTAIFHCKRDRFLVPLIDQGDVHGFPATWNPDDGKFYLHAKGTTDGTNVLGTFAHWGNFTAFAKRKARLVEGV